MFRNELDVCLSVGLLCHFSYSKPAQIKKPTKPKIRQNYTFLKTIQCGGAYKGKGWILVSLFIQMLDGTIKDGVNFKIKKK